MRATAPSLVVLVSIAACATAPRALPQLPGRDAPLPERAVAFREGMASIHTSVWRGIQVRVGESPELLSLRDARPLLERSPAAARDLRTYDQRTATGVGLMAGGAAAMIGGVAATLLLPSERRDGAVLPVTLSLTAIVGLAAMLAGTFTLASGQSHLTRSIESHNHWLWDVLGLPRRGASLATEPASSAPPWAR